MATEKNPSKNLKKDQINTDNVKGGLNTRPVEFEPMETENFAPISIDEVQGLHKFDIGQKSKGTNNTKDQDRNAL